jgi:RecJ-like exonuclease
MRRFSHLVAVLLLVAGLLPAHAWKGEAGGAVRTAAEVNEKAEEGDVVTVEGEVIDVSSGPGSLRLAVVEDETGQVLVAVAEHLRRNIERDAAEDPVGVRVRVTGRWDHGYLKQDRWAIRATSVERLD